jgi:ParB-like nuclease domain
MIERIAIDKLKLDPNNPRLPLRLKDKEEKYVIDWMLNDASLIDLMASITENGFFEGEPLIGIRDKSEVIIIEGNRRLAAVKLLNNPDLATSNKTTIANLISTEKAISNIPKEINVYLCKSREEVANYLGFRHVSGVKQWPVIAKARYLVQLYEDPSRDKNDPNIYKELAKEIGSKASYVRRLLFGYKLFEKIQENKFYNIKDIESEEDFSLSLITDAATMHSTIADYLGFDLSDTDPMKTVKEDKLEEVTKWLYQVQGNGFTRVRENRELRILNKVLQNDLAKEAFITGNKTLKEAAELTEITDESITYCIAIGLSNLRDAQAVVHKSIAPTQTDINNLQEISSITKLLIAVLGDRFTEVARQTINK